MPGMPSFSSIANVISSGINSLKGDTQSPTDVPPEDNSTPLSTPQQALPSRTGGGQEAKLRKEAAEKQKKSNNEVKADPDTKGATLDMDQLSSVIKQLTKGNKDIVLTKEQQEMRQALKQKLGELNLAEEFDAANHQAAASMLEAMGRDASLSAMLKKMYEQEIDRSNSSIDRMGSIK